MENLWFGWTETIQEPIITWIKNVVRIVFKKKKVHFNTWFLLKLLEIHLNNKKNMIELIDSMEELIHQKKFNWTIKYVVVLKLKKNHNELAYCIEET